MLYRQPMAALRAVRAQARRQVQQQLQVRSELLAPERLPEADRDGAPERAD